MATNYITSEDKAQNLLEVLEDFQTESPCEYQRIKNIITSQGGILSSMMGEVKVEVNHRLPFMENIGKYLSSLFSSSEDEDESKQSPLLHWYLCALIACIILFTVGGITTKFARSCFLLCLGAGSILCSLSIFGSETFGNSRLSLLTTSIREVYNEIDTADDIIAEKVASNPDLPDVEMEIVDAQSGLSTEAISGLLLVVLSVGFGCSPKSNGLNTIKEYLKMTPIVKNNMFELISSSLTMMGDLFEKINCQDFLRKIIDLPVTDDYVVAYVHKVSNFINSVSTSTDGSHEDNTIAYNSFVLEAKQLEKSLTKGTLSSITLIDTVKNLERCKNAMNRRFASLQGFRPEPVMVFFLGEPATMKSTLSGRIADILNRLTLNETLLEDYKMHPSTYTYRRSTDKWWDGYSSKANVAICDDMWQIVDPGSSPSESESAILIRMTNTEEFAVPVAVAESKNGIFFRSNFIVGNGNVFAENLINSVHSKGAVRRRLHFFVNVTINPKYKLNPNDPKDNTVDKTKLPHLKDISGVDIQDATSLPSDFWNFTYNETVSNVAPTTFEPISYIDLVEKMVRRFYLNRQRLEMNKLAAQTSYEDEAAELLERLRPARNNLYTMQTIIADNGGLNEIPIPGAFAQSGLQETMFPDPEVPVVSFATLPTVPQLLINARDRSPMGRLLFVKEGYATLSTLVRRSTNAFFVDQIIPLVPIYGWYDSPFEEFLESLRPGELVSYHDILCNYFLGNITEELVRTEFNNVTGTIVTLRADTNRDIMMGTDLSFLQKVDFAKYRFSRSLRRARTWINDHKFEAALLAMAAAATVFSITACVKQILGKKRRNRPYPQSFSRSGELSKGPSRGKPTLVKTPAKPKENSVPISQSDGVLQTLFNGSSVTYESRSAHKDVLTALIDKNQFIMYVHLSENGVVRAKRLGHCTNLRSNHFGMPFHFTLDMEDFREAHPLGTIYVTLTTASNARKFSMDMSELLRSVVSTPESEEVDFCTFTGGHETSAKGALHFFIDDIDHRWERKLFTPISVIGSRQHGDNKEHTSFRIIETSANFLKDDVIVKANWKTDGHHTHYALMNTLSYSGNFGAGDCGSLVVLQDFSLGSRIVAGMHVCGTASTGYSNVLTRSFIESLLDVIDFSPTIQEELIPQGLLREEKLHYDYLKPVMLARGKFDSSHRVNICSKSQILRSVLYGKIPGDVGIVKEQPSLLYAKTINGVLIDPKEIALQNYARFPPPIEKDVVDKAVQSYYSIIKRYDDVKIESKTIIPVHTSLTFFGDHVKGIASNTSAGWPMNTSSTPDLKKEYFRAVRDENFFQMSFIVTEIERKVYETEKLYASNIRPVFIYSDALKDETRPIQKCLEGKTRMFSGCPFILLVMFRRYFGNFIDYYFDKNLLLGSAIGINPYSSHWHDLANHLLKFSSNDSDLAIGAGDYSKFDCSEAPLVLNGILDIIQAWYGARNPVEDHVRRMLWLEITNSRHVFGEDYYEWSNGMPSGNPMTAIINTMYNQLAFRMAFHYCGAPMDQYNKNVYMCALGDDNVFSVSEKFRELFNELTMVNAMKMIGLTYTTEFKGTAEVPFRKITEVEFLKRKFSLFRLNFMGGETRYLAPIQMNTIVNMLYWTKKGPNKLQISRDNVALALRELSFHGKEVYEFYRPILEDLTEKYLPGISSHHASHVDFKSVLRDTMNLEHEF